jgi:folate-binding protein YgfZ
MTREELKQILLTNTFIYDRSAHPIIEVSGKDHREWIHRISSQSSFKLKAGEVCTTAFLTGTGGVISYFQLLVLEDKVWILAEPQSKEKILSYLDFSHFGEDISFKAISQSNYFEVVGKHSPIDGCLQFSSEAWNEGGRIYIDGEKPEHPPIDKNTYDLIKHSKGWPIDNKDITEENILLEAAVLNEYASDTKGCYPGQEVIAKIITYGRVAKKYVSLWASIKPSSEEITYSAGKAGKVMAVHALKDGYLVFAYVLRAALDQFEASRDSLKIDNQDLTKF